MDFKYIVTALRHCRKLRALKHGKSFHSHLIKTGFSPSDVYMMNNLISMYADFSLPNDARNLFDEMPVRNIVTWTSMVHACNTIGKPHDAIELYNEMLDAESEILPTGFMYSAVLKACGLVGDVELGRLIHQRIRDEGLEEDVVLMNILLHMYVKCDKLSDAREVFDGMISRASTASWNTIISGYCKRGLMKEAVDLFRQMPDPNVVSWNSVVSGLADSGSVRTLEFMSRMHSEGLKLDEFTFPSGLKVCGDLGFLAMGKQIHGCALKSGFESCSYTLSALLDMYSNSNALDEAVRLFESYCKGNGSDCFNLAFWNSMVSGYVGNGKNIEALNLLTRIHSSGVILDSYTWSSALKVCNNLVSFRLGVQVHGLVVTSGYELDCVVGSILTDLYAKVGRMKDAFVIFGRLPEKDSVAWSGLITGCAKAGLNTAAFSLFRDMVDSGLDVDQFVISGMLNVCSSVSTLGRGKQIHTLCIKKGYEMEPVAATALIDMYSKCGEIEDSIALFEHVVDRDVVCWTGIIVGCGQNGKANKALEIFRKMIESGVEPNEVTFFGVLAACRHGGRVEDALSIFQLMKSNHGLEPQQEHYFCLVDVLGQAGLIKEAVDLVSEMPFKPNKTIWSSLLAACVTHKGSEMISWIAENLQSAFPDDPSVYVMISNAYATLGMWDDLSRVREGAKTYGVKESGRSWIEVSG